MLRLFIPVSLLLAGLVLLSCSTTATSSVIPTSPVPSVAQTPATTSPANARTAEPSNTSTADEIRGSNLERASLTLESEGLQFQIVLVTPDSTGVEGEIYRDLRARNIRATTGPDEGIDVSGEPCYPQCMYVPRSEINAITVESWTRVLRHEYRHVVQATNNPEMASDFRDSTGQFTPYAAFSEACADYGIEVDPDYHAQERIDGLKAVLGQDQESLIRRACEGHKPAYEQVVAEYNRRKGSERAFRDLFAPYS